MASGDESDNARVVAVETVVAATAGSLALIDPIAGVAAAGSAPALAAAVNAVLDRVAARANRRAASVLRGAAEALGTDVSDLQERLHSDPSREQLLLRTLGAAENAPLREKLCAYALALARGSIGDGPQVAWETTFVRALDDLDPSHLALLDRFTWSSNRLGLGDGSSDFDRVPEALNPTQLERIANDLENLPALLATLQRHGLVASQSTGGGNLGGSGTVLWSLTSFGRAFLGRLAEISIVLSGADLR